MRTRLLIPIALAVMLTGAVIQPAFAQIRPIKPFVMGGYYTEQEDFYLGGGLALDLLKIQAAGYADYVFVDNGSYYDANIDLYFIALSAVAIYGYIGGGAALVFAKPEGGDTESKAGVNLVAGIKTRLIPLKPFIQVKYTFISESDDPLAIGIGIHF